MVVIIGGSHTREQAQDPAARLGYGDFMSCHDQSIGVTVDDRSVSQVMAWNKNLEMQYRILFSCY